MTCDCGGGNPSDADVEAFRLAVRYNVGQFFRMQQKPEICGEKAIAAAIAVLSLVMREVVLSTGGNVDNLVAGFANAMEELKEEGATHGRVH